MTNTLTARLLAEIERREGKLRGWLTVAASDGWDAYLSDSLAYLAALRKVVGRHGSTHRCESAQIAGSFSRFDAIQPCADLLAVAAALDVTL